MCHPSLTIDYDGEVARDDSTRLFTNTLSTVRHGNFTEVFGGVFNVPIAFQPVLNENTKKRETEIQIRSGFLIVQFNGQTL